MKQHRPILSLQAWMIIVLAAIWIVGTQCTPAVRVSNPVDAFLSRFPTEQDWPDTLHCFLKEPPGGSAIADTLLRTLLDSTQFESLHYGSGEARFWALAQFPYAEGLHAALVQTEESWFGKLSLLVLDLQKQQCVTVVELSHFYGGDGGQTASESWLFRKQIPVQLFVKTAEHGLRVSVDSNTEPEEYLHESGQLFQWQSTQFSRMTNPDSLRYLQRYAMHRTW